MKKVLLICFTLLLSSGMVFAEGVEINKLSGSKRVESQSFSGDPAVGTWKLGLVGGYPSGATLGFRPSDKLEFNAVVGTSYLDFTIGANVLFTLVDIDISGHIFPLSVGPAVYINIPFSTYYGLLTRTFSIDIMGEIRWEYTFKKAPINLFAEVGLGVKIGGYTPVGLGWNSAGGIRYVF